MGNVTTKSFHQYDYDTTYEIDRMILSLNNVRPFVCPGVSVSVTIL